MQRRFFMIALIAFAAAQTWTSRPALAQTFDLGWHTIDGGGGMFSTGGGFELGGTIGQPDANPLTMAGGGFSLIGGFWPGAAPASCHGDCDCNGRVDFGDINPFVAALSGGTPCSFDNCDANGDGLINFADINPFVAILSAGGGPCP